MPRRRKSSRSKRKKRFNAGKLLGRMVIVAALLAIGWWGFGLVRDGLTGTLARTTVARAGTVEQIVAGDGWVMPTIAEAQVAPLDGMAYLKAPDGERTRVGNCVVEIVDPDAQRALVDQLSQVDNQIAELKRRNAGERDAANQRLTEIEALLTAKLAELKEVTAKSDQAAVQRLQREIRDLGAEKQTLEAKLVSLDKSEADLAVQRDQTSGTISRSSYQMLAMFPGVISYRFDGLEDTLTPEQAVALGSRGLWALRERAATTKDKQLVQAGQTVFKVLDPSATYIALAVKADQFTDLGQGPVRLRFPDFAGATAQAEFVKAGKPERNGYLIAVYRTAEFLNQFGQARRVSVEIVKSAENGVVVPATAVVRRAGVTGVWAIKVGTARFSPVTVLSNNGVFAAVSGIDDGCEVVKVGRLVFREGQRIK